MNPTCTLSLDNSLDGGKETENEVIEWGGGIFFFNRGRSRW